VTTIDHPPSTNEAEPPFSSLAIIGLGLIGGSIALAVRERWPSIRLVAVDRPAALAHGLGSNAIDRGAATIAEMGRPELVVLAAPVRENVSLLPQVAAHVDGSALITDVGGTKRDIVGAARALPRSVTFVGGHPIGGAERGGFAFARPDLFAGRPWIFTPETHDVSDPLDRLMHFVRGLGARPTMMEAGAHDRLMAFLSHLPQLTASALMEIVGSAATGEGLRLAGRGLIDTTRLASSPSSLWRDVCAANADEIGQALDLLIERLTELRADLERGDAIEVIFDEAARWRAELMKGRD
jgi:prephenate dehydrogenase